MVSSESPTGTRGDDALAQISDGRGETRGGGDVVDVGRVERVVSIVVDETRERGGGDGGERIGRPVRRGRETARAGDAQGGALGRAATPTRRRERERWW